MIIFIPKDRRDNTDINKTKITDKLFYRLCDDLIEEEYQTGVSHWRTHYFLWDNDDIVVSRDEANANREEYVGRYLDEWDDELPLGQMVYSLTIK